MTSSLLTKHGIFSVQGAVCRLGKLLACMAITGAYHHTMATPLYWDANGTTAGAGAAPTGIWGTDNFWNSDSTGAAAGSFTAATTSSDSLTFVAASGAGSGSTAFTVSLNGNQAASGITVGASGGITLGVDSSTTINLGTGGFNTLTGGSGTNTVNSKIALQADQSWSLVRGVTFNGAISGTANLTITGNSTKTFNAANSYIGTTTLSGASTNVLSLAGTAGSIGTGDFIYSGGALQFNHTVDFIFSNNITGSGGSQIRKNNSNTLTLTGSNTSASQYLIRGGAISVNSISQLGTSGIMNFGAASSTDSGTLIYTGGVQSTALQLNVNGTTGSFAAIQNDGSGALTFTNAAPVTYGSTGTKKLILQGTNAGNNEIQGNLVNSSGALSLEKNGAGKWILSGSNSYTGTTTVNAGTLLVNGAFASAVTVTAGAFGGIGTSSANVTIGNSTGTADAFIAPGNSAGMFTTTGALSLLSDAQYQFELNGTTAQADKLVANGVTINSSASFSFTLLGDTSGLSVNQAFTIIDNTAGGNISGEFSNLSAGGSFNAGGGLTFSANGGGGVYGNDLILTVTAVPEPATFGLLAMALASITFFPSSSVVFSKLPLDRYRPRSSDVLLTSLLKHRPAECVWPCGSSAASA